MMLSCIHGYDISATTYCVNLQCQVKESRRDEFVRLIIENRIRTLVDEPDALQYVVGEDVRVRNVFYIHEQFRSAAAFDHHRSTPHNANWQEFKNSDPFEVPPVAHFYHVTAVPVTTTNDDGHAERDKPQPLPEKIPIRPAFCRSGVFAGPCFLVPPAGGQKCESRRPKRFQALTQFTQPSGQ
jgi:quinol monooxygenase YgiN